MKKRLFSSGIMICLCAGLMAGCGNKDAAGGNTPGSVPEPVVTQDAATQATVKAALDKAKAAVDAKKWQDAMNALGEIGTIQLTPEQQKTFSDLNVQVRTGMREAAAGGGK